MPRELDATQGYLLASLFSPFLPLQDLASEEVRVLALVVTYA
jgi:hypothetical protein